MSLFIVKGENFEVCVERLIDYWNESSFNMHAANCLLSARRKLLFLVLLVRETLRILVYAIKM